MDVDYEILINKRMRYELLDFSFEQNEVPFVDCWQVENKGQEKEGCEMSFRRIPLPLRPCY